jgi:hypothetical protein
VAPTPPPPPPPLRAAAAEEETATAPPASGAAAPLSLGLGFRFGTCGLLGGVSSLGPAKTRSRFLARRPPVVRSVVTVGGAVAVAIVGGGAVAVAVRSAVVLLVLLS